MFTSFNPPKITIKIIIAIIIMMIIIIIIIIIIIKSSNVVKETKILVIAYEYKLVI